SSDASGSETRADHRPDHALGDACPCEMKKKRPLGTRRGNPQARQPPVLFQGGFKRTTAELPPTWGLANRSQARRRQVEIPPYEGTRSGVASRPRPRYWKPKAGPGWAKVNSPPPRPNKPPNPHRNLPTGA